MGVKFEIGVAVGTTLPLDNIEEDFDAIFIGVGLGSDTGGFNALPEADPAYPVTYPFRSYDRRVSLGREVAGTREYDLNKDGVANYGLFADLIAATRQAPGGGEATALLFRSAEAYLRTWEAAERA